MGTRHQAADANATLPRSHSTQTPTARAELVLSGVTCGCEEQTPGTDEVPTEGGWQHLRGALLRPRRQLSRERHTHGQVAAALLHSVTGDFDVEKNLG